MSKRDEFVAFISSLKAVSRTITDEQRKGILRQATLEYEVHVDDAVEILQAAGLVVGQNDNYFEILDISIAELNNLSEDAITAHVNASHKKLYATSLAAGGLPRSDRRSQEQWRNILNAARDTLIDPLKKDVNTLQLSNKLMNTVWTHIVCLLNKYRMYLMDNVKKLVMIIYPMELLYLKEWFSFLLVSFKWAVMMMRHKRMNIRFMLFSLMPT